MLESLFQAKLIKDLKKMFPGCMILKNDAHYIQGVPDLLILFENTWAALEIKRSAYDSYRPNQEFYIDELRKMSYATFIYPENKEEVLNELQQAFRSDRPARISRR